MKKNYLLLFALILCTRIVFSQTDVIKNEPYSISANINSEEGSEFLPSLSTDGKTLYFVADDRPDNIGKEDVFVSYFVDGEWTVPEIVPVLSTPTSNDAPLSVSADGNSMLLFRDGKIYTSQRTKEGWTEPLIMKDLNYSDWNGDAVYTADGNAIIFASGTKNFFAAEVDIYVITRNQDDTWSKPINLGETINAGEINRSPFLHPDMKTLYFSTDGNEGYGSLDVFVSTRLDEKSWTKWSEPKNLGSSINTSGHDWGLKITTQGDKAIFNRADSISTNIFMVDITEDVQPERVVVVTGVVTDKNKNPLEAEIIWEDLETGNRVGNLKTNPANGEYIITLPQGKNYGFFVSKEAYYPVSDNVDLRKEVTNFEIRKDFVMNDIKTIIEQEQTIQLNNLFFETAKHDIKKESYPELNRLADFLKENPKVKIEISGHTDNVGADHYNQNLSELRANEVMKYLIGKGCNKNQLTAKGYGKTKPIASNNNAEGRAKNRRVEFKVIK